MNLKFLAFFLLVYASSIFGLKAQYVVAQRQPANEKSIPLVIKNIYNEQYPKATLMGWYATHITYWQNDYSSDWYYGWYGQRSVVVYSYQKPNYYEVEFSQYPGELSRALYNIYGYWYETRTQIKGLPLAIMEALKETKYSNWKISLTKEKLESPAWPVEIYRFHVSKGLKSQIMRMDEKGNLIQIKEVADSF